MLISAVEGVVGKDGLGSSNIIYVWIQLFTFRFDRDTCKDNVDNARGTCRTVMPSKNGIRPGMVRRYLTALDGDEDIAVASFATRFDDFGFGPPSSRHRCCSG